LLDDAAPAGTEGEAKCQLVLASGRSREQKIRNGGVSRGPSWSRPAARLPCDQPSEIDVFRGATGIAAFSLFECAQRRVKAASRTGAPAVRRPSHRPYLAVAPAAAEELIAAVGLEPGHVDAWQHVDWFGASPVRPVVRQYRGMLR